MKDLNSVVTEIINTVRRRGDAALCHYARQFDQVKLRPGDLRVTDKERKGARKKIAPAVVKALEECARKIRHFAEQEKRRLAGSWLERNGTTEIGQLVRAVESVGLYIPGGRYPYPSTVLMSAIPAAVAGVDRVVMATPPRNLTTEVLLAAELAGVDEIYRVGGPAAIAALAYGTAHIEAVSLIVGPGNAYVTEAKRQVYGKVGIDLLAGPSEVVIIADRSIPAEYIQADLLAQAEHDPSATAVLFARDAKLIARVRDGLPSGLRRQVRFVRVKNWQKAFDQANEIAPEHLELLLPNAERFLALVRHAGAVFVGPASPAAMGDYVAGPSHVLPTSGAARFSSGLSVATFLKRSSLIGFTGRPSEKADWAAALTMAQTEGMTHHAESLRVRMARKR